MNDTQQKNPFQNTLNLPQTTFSIRANAAIKEPEILAKWEKENLWHEASIKNKGKQKFLLHDGPPYANGNLHLGHALTYILKDIVCKAKRMDGYYAPLVPGWDCHGLPIEIKVTTELGVEKSKETIDPVMLKKACREYAKKWIEIQKKELKELGKLADYEHAYKTMEPEYEASVLDALATFVEKGYLERKLKTVPWCASCQTVLAAAEIEYEDRKDPSLYVAFPFVDADARITLPFLFEDNKNLQVSFLVWTTTPWTIPLNRAVVLNPEAEYVIIQGRTPNEALIMATSRAQAFCSASGLPYKELAKADSIVFTGKRVHHPLVDGLTVPLLFDEMVSVDDGTACLHSAPGCGPEDYLLGVKHGLEIYSPLASDGTYTQAIKPEELAGMKVTDGHIWVIKKLVERDRLVYKTSINHSYPHCWRCHNGLMFRATNQWFCDLQKHDLVTRSLDAIQKMSFVPSWGKERLHAFTGGRTEWCLSRQRRWGVPIPAIMCKKTGKAVLDADVIRGVAAHVAKEGVEFWDRMTPQGLIDLKIITLEKISSWFSHSDITNLVLERDILDVWFDSGVSHHAVLAKDSENLGLPADVYFEGSDQHRGWFQSSLLCGMVLYGQSPTKQIITHGYTVDENKRKMSKSIGNIVAPNEIVTKYSRDVLRLWVASADFEGDIVISERLLANIFEMYRKIRNTCRFLLSNLYDFDIMNNGVASENLKALDYYALAKFYEISSAIKTSYTEHHFATVVQLLNNYCTNDLSAVYLDILKDRLYVEKADSVERRSAQTVLYYILDGMTRLMAPIVSFLSEELSDHYQKDKRESIHLQDFCEHRDLWKEPLKTQWRVLEEIRDAVLKAIEPHRAAGTIKHPYEAHVTLWIDPKSDQGKAIKLFLDTLATKEDTARFLSDWFIVSHVTFVDNHDSFQTTEYSWLRVVITHADGVKCPRCWQWQVGAHAEGLCSRCARVLGR